MSRRGHSRDTEDNENDAQASPVGHYFRISCFEQFLVRGSRQTDVSGALDIVPQASQVPGRGGIDVLVEQKPQTGAARKRISSAPTKAIA